MAVETFTWATQGGESPDIAYRVRESQFADGYKQTVADGPNNKTQSFPITHTGFKPEILLIMAFFDRHAGARSFLWTNPLGELGFYKCAKPTPTPVGGTTWKITATFEQAFAP
jgi:phage-related protein